MIVTAIACRNKSGGAGAGHYRNARRAPRTRVPAILLLDPGDRQPVGAAIGLAVLHSWGQKHHPFVDGRGAEDRVPARSLPARRSPDAGGPACLATDKESKPSRDSTASSKRVPLIEPSAQNAKRLGSRIQQLQSALSVNRMRRLGPNRRTAVLTEWTCASKFRKFHARIMR
jgi:hypothetical protein